MGITRRYYGAPSYTISNGSVDLRITVQGGHLTADFDVGGRKVCPYFIAPWWREQVPEATEDIIRVLRGDFFCLPFGNKSETEKGVHPSHGEPANRCWDLVGREEQGEQAELRLAMDLELQPGRVEKTVRLHEGEPVIYQENRVSGFSGKTSIAYHPTLQFPPGLATGIIDLSKPLAGFITPEAAGDPAGGAYSILKPGAEIGDRSAVSCIDGSTTDISRYPHRQGFVDVVLFASDPQAEFCYTAATFPDQGYLYFQLKDPRVLRSTMFWMSNGGRHTQPWSGRVQGVLGMEEITAFFHYGLEASVRPNFLQERGFSTFLEIDPGKPLCVRLICGAAAVGADFRDGVERIERKDERSVRIVGRSGAEIEVPCRVDFLRC